MSSDHLLNAVLVSGLVVFALTLSLLVVIVALRLLLDHRQRRAEQLSEVWRPHFVHAVEGLSPQTPGIYGRDRLVILMLWLHFSESVRGEGLQRLCDMGRALKFAGSAQRLLDRRSLSSRLVAVAVLGRLRDRGCWSRLVTLMDHPNALLSLLAARSLLQIDAEAGVPLLLARIGRRSDWPMVKVVEMLADLPTDLAAAPLLAAIAAADTPALPRLLRLLEVVHVTDAWQTLEPLLGESQPAELLANVLRVCNDPRVLNRARALAAHHEWIVRTQAAGVLGRIGSLDDRDLLMGLLGDPVWWVRYRAARALLLLPQVGRPGLLELAKNFPDRFGRDILLHALAETERAP